MIKILMVDCDGTLTNGMYNTSENGVVFKTFFSRDFHGMMLLNQLGVKIAILTTASDDVIGYQCRRAAPYISVYKNIKDKYKFVVESDEFQSFDLIDMAFMGDDTFDIPLLQEVGLPACPHDADSKVFEVIEGMDDGFISQKMGGSGAVREFADYICDLIKGSNVEESTTPD